MNHSRLGRLLWITTMRGFKMSRQSLTPILTLWPLWPLPVFQLR